MRLAVLLAASLIVIATASHESVRVKGVLTCGEHPYNGAVIVLYDKNSGKRFLSFGTVVTTFFVVLPDEVMKPTGNPMTDVAGEVDFYGTVHLYTTTDDPYFKLFHRCHEKETVELTLPWGTCRILGG